MLETCACGDRLWWARRPISSSRSSCGPRATPSGLDTALHPATTVPGRPARHCWDVCRTRSRLRRMGWTSRSTGSGPGSRCASVSGCSAMSSLRAAATRLLPLCSAPGLTVRSNVTPCGGHRRAASALSGPSAVLLARDDRRRRGRSRQGPPDLRILDRSLAARDTARGHLLASRGRTPAGDRPALTSRARLPAQPAVAHPPTNNTTC